MKMGKELDTDVKISAEIPQKFENYVANSLRGNCISFDSKIPHWVSEVTEGVRYSMVFWAKKSDLMIPQQII